MKAESTATRIEKCEKCELQLIAGDLHVCPLENAFLVYFKKLNDSYYIDMVARKVNGKITVGSIPPIPIPSYIRKSSDESLHKEASDGF